MPVKIHRSLSDKLGHDSAFAANKAVQTAKAKEAFRGMLPLIETYLGNPTIYCWMRLVDYYDANFGTMNYDIVNIPGMKWEEMLIGNSRSEIAAYEAKQGMIYIGMTMLKEAIMNELYPERMRDV